jgi:hypothetical protein
MKSCEDIIQAMFHAMLTIKLYHWQTRSFSRHKATDNLFTTIVTLTDTFMETFIGRHSRPRFSDGLRIAVNELSDNDAVLYLHDLSSYLRKDMPKFLSSSDTDLLNIRDELLSSINQTLYLFTLK